MEIQNSELKKQSLLEHLYAFRKLLVVCSVSVLVCFIVVLALFSNDLIDFLITPIEEKGIDVVYLAVAEAFTIQMKVSFIAGFILASPIIFFQIWAFVKPALYKEERFKFFLLYFSAVMLFIIGIIFSYTSVFTLAVNFFIISGETIATPMISIEKYVNFLFGFLIPFGLVFQLPIIVILLTKKGVVSVDTLVKYRKYVIFTAFVLAAILTPPDFVSQIMLGLPIVILYEVGIFISKFTSKTPSH